MVIRLLACDIDNTLVRYPQPPSPRVVQALHAAQDAGVIVALVTGRAFRRAQPIARTLNLTAPLVCNHGGTVRSQDGRVLHQEMIPRDLMREIVAWLQTQQVSMILFSPDHIYHDCQPEQVISEFHVYTNGQGTTFVPDLCTQIPDETEILLTTALDHDHLAGVYACTKDRFGNRARVLFTHPHGMDILASNAFKSHALAWLAEQIGARQSEIMAIGDGHNDVDMLSWAGLGVAMGDGEPETKAAADVIAPDFDDDGAAWAVEKYILA